MIWELFRIDKRMYAITLNMMTLTHICKDDAQRDAATFRPAVDLFGIHPKDRGYE